MSKLGIDFLTKFREIFVFHHYSLEFRAKLFAAMLILRRDINDDDEIYTQLQKIGEDIYHKNQRRIDILIKITKEYVNKNLSDPKTNIDLIIFDINSILKYKKHYAKKINVEHLMLLRDNLHEDIGVVQVLILKKGVYKNMIKHLLIFTF